MDTEDIQPLRRCIRDLVALSTLSEVWATDDRRQIAESLADVLLRVAELDLAYVRLSDDVEGPVEIVRGREGRIAPDLSRAVRDALCSWLDSGPVGDPPSSIVTRISPLRFSS